MKHSIGKITVNNAEYPPLLKEIQNRPETVFFKGKLPEKDELCIAIVGTRKATSDGKQTAKETAKKLSEMGFVIVSGLAFGIDAAAHEGAILGDGRTIAVLANGVDEIYPREHENLGNKILEKNGCICSEYPEGTPSLPHHFLERNRIISGLSIATIVIEAPMRSGAIATARNASEQGREVFIFPGARNNPNYKGSHNLIRNGGRLVSCVEDIVEDLKQTIENLSMDFPKQNNQIFPEDIDDETDLCILKIIQENNSNGATIDNIIEFTKLEPRIIQERIAILFVQEMIKEQNGKFFLTKK